MGKLIFWCGDELSPKAMQNLIFSATPVPSEQHSTLEMPKAGPGDLVLVMGMQAVEVCQTATPPLLPKNRTINSLRSVLHSYPNGAKFLVSYSPGIGDIDHGKLVDLHMDYKLATRYVRTGTLGPALGAYRYVPDLTEFIAQVNSLVKATGSPARVALDLETETTNPYDPHTWIISLQVSCEAGKADVLYFTPETPPGYEVLQQVDWLLNTDRVYLRGANLKYDLTWLAVKWGLTCTNFRFDTGIVGSLLDENRSNSLKTHAKIYTDLGGYSDAFDRKYDKARMSTVPKEELLVYAGADADATLQVADTQLAHLNGDKPLIRFYSKILHPASRTYEKVERCGVLVDVPAYQQLKADLEKELIRLEQTAFKHMSRSVLAKHPGAALTKPALILDFMFGPRGLNLKPLMTTPKSGKPSTAMEHLELFKTHPDAAPFIRALGEYNSAAKTLSTFVVGFLNHLCPDSRFHPTYFLYNQGDTGGTVTGRLSAKDPAFQTVPKHTTWAKRIRKCFIAPPGMVILAPDYSQGELRIAACIADEPNMIQAYREDIDLHEVTGSMADGLTWEQFLAIKAEDPARAKKIRQGGKAGNFGLIYGMREEGFVDYAASTYGVTLSLEEATAFRDKFFTKYARLLAWHKAYKTMARKQKKVYSPLGRVRHLPLISSPDRKSASKAERQSINAPVQSTLSDMSLWATALLDQEYGMNPQGGFCAFGMVHDQLLFYAPEDEAELWAGRVKDVMEHLPFHEVGWAPALTFRADMEIGPNLADLK